MFRIMLTEHYLFPYITLINFAFIVVTGDGVRCDLKHEILNIVKKKF
jgi:hypothetical protein